MIEIKICSNCGLSMDLIENETLWFCGFGCSKMPNTTGATSGGLIPITLTHFLSFYFNPNETLWIFAFSPKDVPEELREIPVKISTSIEALKADKSLQKRLVNLNETLGVYFVVNAGGTKKDEITRINAAFCEIDDLTIQEQHDLFDNAPYPPSIRLETKKSVHAYWLPSELWTTEQFHTLQNGLIDYFNSDKALKNENRLMRLPFFNHVSFDAGEYIYKKVEINNFSTTAFSFDELSKAYPEPQISMTPAPDFAEYKNSQNDWQDLFAEMRNRFRGLPGYHVEAGGKLASAQGVCHHGETNRSIVLNLQTGVIFCRNECTFDEILSALNLERPKRREKRILIPRTSAPIQSSDLYRAITQGV